MELLPDELSNFVRTKQNYPKKDDHYQKKACNVPSFLKHMVTELHEEIEYIENIRKQILPALLNSNNDSKQIYKAAKILVDDSERAAFDELIVLQRQKKFLADDLTEELLLAGEGDELPFEEINMLYTETMTQRINNAGVARKEQHLNVSSFRYLVELRYESVTKLDNSSRCWCHVLGWFPPSEVEATHIVPKALDSPELSYLFGAAGEDTLSDPRNGKDNHLQSFFFSLMPMESILTKTKGLMLHKTIKKALHSGQIIILPLSLTGKGPTEWKLVVTNPKLLNNSIWTESTGFISWGVSFTFILTKATHDSI